MKHNLGKLSKQLSSNPTKWEKDLLLKLHQWRIESLFQFVFGPYICDFYLPAYGLIIELDGKHHYRGLRVAKDKKRDEYFSKLGHKTLRLPNNLITSLTESDFREMIAKLNPQPIDKSFNNLYLESLLSTS